MKAGFVIAIALILFLASFTCLRAETVQDVSDPPNVSAHHLCRLPHNPDQLRVFVECVYLLENELPYWTQHTLDSGGQDECYMWQLSVVDKALTEVSTYGQSSSMQGLLYITVAEMAIYGVSSEVDTDDARTLCDEALNAGEAGCQLLVTEHHNLAPLHMLRAHYAAACGNSEDFGERDISQSSETIQQLQQLLIASVGPQSRQLSNDSSQSVLSKESISQRKHPRVNQPDIRIIDILPYAPALVQRSPSLSTGGSVSIPSAAVSQ
jgi:hypothetical protein